jgi:hypothetical protein
VFVKVELSIRLEALALGERKPKSTIAFCRRFASSGNILESEGTIKLSSKGIETIS